MRSCLHSIKRRDLYALMLLGSGLSSTFYFHVTPSQAFFAFRFFCLHLPPAFNICHLFSTFFLSLSFCFLCTSLPHVILSHSCACHHILKIEGHAISYIISMLLETQQMLLVDTDTQFSNIAHENNTFLVGCTALH